ncbi:MAG: DUF559 domain-containing protein [Acidimicrobiales bacterium]|nr:DUF559 domain-containing protein [Acidimicrobiales bacterium]
MGGATVAADFPRSSLLSEEVVYPLIELAAPLLRAQHSLITRRQSIRLGNSEACVRHLLRNGVWETVDTGLYGPTGVAMTWRRQLMAGVLLAPAGSLISHRASAALHGVGGLDRPRPEITVPRGRRLRRPWLITHESLDLAMADRIVIDGIPTTGLRRLAVDLGGVVSFARFKHTIREIRHGHGISSDQLLHTYLRHKRQGRTGSGSLRDWLDRYFTIAGTSESGPELVVLDAILDAGLAPPVRQHELRVGGRTRRLDLAYPALKIAIEVDGIQHDDVDVGEDDAARTEALVTAGWTVLRVRARKLATDLPGLLRELRTRL